MYMDLITYCPDTTALIAELKAKFPDKMAKDPAGNVIGQQTPPELIGAFA